MIKLLQKLVVLWEKSKFLTLMEMETDYLREANGRILGRDTDSLRAKLSSLKAIKNPKSDVQRDMIDIEQLINETEKFRQMIQSSKEKGLDLKNQIAKYRAELWK